MRTLNEILLSPCNPTEYLEKKRAQFKDAFSKKTDEVIELGKNPAFLDSVLRQCENYMKNLYILPGTGGKFFFVGDPPAWNVKAVSDEEYLYSLNRLHGILPLCRAYILTGEEKYGKKAVADLLSWIEDCPRPSLDGDNSYLIRTFQGLTPWRLLECGIRTFESWNYFYQYLLLTDVMTPEVHEIFARSIYEHAEVISLISPKAWPTAAHNHYIHEMLGLLVIAYRFPEFDRAEEWRKTATRELFRCVRAQIMPDGAHLEACANYHNGCMDMLTQMVRLMLENKVEIPDDIYDLLQRAYDHSAWTITPNGNLTSVGDSYMIPQPFCSLADNIFAIHGNTGKLKKALPLVKRSMFTSTPDSEFEAARLEAAATPGGVRNYRSIGQIIGRTGWTDKDSYFLLNCRSPVFNGHAQQDTMSFMLFLEGKEISVDPSYFTYDDNEDRKTFKSIKYHSSLTFADKEPFEYTSRWTFTPQGEGSTVSSYESDGLLAADAYNLNYTPCEHRRLCALLGKDVFVVCDDVYNPTHEEVKLRFHLDSPDYTLTECGACYDGINIRLPEGKYDITPAAKSPTNDRKIPTCIVSAVPAAQGENELYVTVFSTRGTISEAKAEKCGSEIVINVSVNGEKKTLAWKFGESCELR